MKTRSEITADIAARDAAIADAGRLREALEAAPTVTTVTSKPVRWKMVTVEPDEALISIGAKAIQRPHGEIARNMAKNAYCAMVAAAEAAPTEHASAPVESGWREALKQAEEAFESIRMDLIHNLKEPERESFWKAVSSRDAIRAFLKKDKP